MLDDVLYICMSLVEIIHETRLDFMTPALFLRLGIFIQPVNYKRVMLAYSQSL